MNRASGEQRGAERKQSWWRAARGLRAAALLSSAGGWAACGGAEEAAGEPGARPEPGGEGASLPSAPPALTPPPAFTPPSAAELLPGVPLEPERGGAPGRVCAAQVIEPEALERVVEIPIEEEVVVPSVFYLMLDSSGSMVNDPFSIAGLIEDILDLFGLGQAPPQPTKWEFALEGLERFVRDPASAGLELALGYFPGGGTCDGAGYDIPAVPLGVLPESGGALLASLDAREPAGGTPLEGALRGATGFCLAFNEENPGASCVAVLVTDGAAEECDARSAAELAAIAASAAERGVITFAAGMQGADFAVLDAIGRAGGGDCDPRAAGFACDLTADRDAFVNALGGIRDRTRTQTRIETRIVRETQPLPCAWALPSPSSGQSVDPARVNVELTVGAADPVTLEQVADAESCGGSSGWHYDDARAPSSILACPATCQELGAEPDTRVNLLFGCDTVIR